MTLHFAANQKINNIIRTIDGLLDGDFPMDAGRAGLKTLRHVFDELSKRLERSVKIDDTESIKQYSDNINLKILQCLPIIGFILRSTNVRNAFEFLVPLQKLCADALQGVPKLLLSSEWDYIPFAYPQSLPELKSFVLIGMPASEASNALLIPLAGHELGHAVWRNRGVEGTVHSTIQLNVEGYFHANMKEFTRLFGYDEEDMYNKDILPDTIALVVDRAVYHAEEIFSDMFAFCVFGAAYLRAFAYILAPGSGQPASERHPASSDRIKILQNIAEIDGQDVPSADDLGIIVARHPSGGREKFIAAATKDAVDKVVKAVWEYITTIVTDAKIARPLPSAIAKHLTEFRSGIPSNDPRCLGDIINAGWLYLSEVRKEKGGPKSDQEKIDHLNELILKTVEVLEFRGRTS